MAACPICKKAEADPKYRPFCSRRCSDVDLQRWFSGVYVLPADPEEPGPENDPQD
jgi:hypothetical protein